MRIQIRDPESFCPGIQDGTFRIRDLGSGINMQPTEKITNIPLDTVPYALDIKKTSKLLHILYTVITWCICSL
jgi:hypothetical protein